MEPALFIRRQPTQQIAFIFQSHRRNAAPAKFHENSAGVTDMWVRAAVLTASIFMAGNAVAADTSNCAMRDASGTSTAKTVAFDPNATIARGQAQTGAETDVAPLYFGQFSDLEGGRGPDPHARQLTDIAVSAAFGNRDAVEIASGQLRKSGVTREAIAEAIDWTHVHDAPARAQPQFGARNVGLNASSVWVVSY